MAGPNVNVVLRLDSSKVKDDAEKAKGLLSTAINPTVDVFNVAEKAAQAFGKALEFGGKALVFLTERTGAVQSLTETLSDTRRAIGEAADRSGALRTATEAIEEAARSLAEFFRSDEGRTAVNGFFGLIATGAANAIDTVNGALKALQDLRWWMAGQGLIDGPMVLPLDGETPQQAALTQLADRLRAAGDTSREGSGVRDRGTYVDKEAIEAAKAREEANAKSMDAAVARIEAERKAGEGLVKTLNDQAKAERDAAMRSLDSKRAIAELTRQVEEGKTETAIRNAERRAELEEKNLAAQKARDEQAAQAAESSAATLTGLANMATQGVANAITAGAAAIASGGDLGAAIASAMGGAVAALGATLIATGTGVLAGIALGNVIPGLKALFPDWGAPAAVAAIGVGTLLVGGGSYIQSLAAGGGSSAGSTGATNARTPAAGAGRSTGFRGTPEGFAGASLSPVTTILNYNFNGPMGGSPRRIAREIRDLSTAGDTLLPGYRSPGGR
jgi:hypothetical protein